MTTVGEPIQPEAWLWYYKVHRRRGRRHRRHLVADRDGRAPHHEPAGPRRHETRQRGQGPCQASARYLRRQRRAHRTASSGQAGNLVIEDPWPGMLQTVYGNDERFIEEYWQDFSDTDSDDRTTGCTRPATAPSTARTTTSAMLRTARRRDERRRPPPRDDGTRIRRRRGRRRRRSRRRARGRSREGEVPDVYVVLRDGIEESDAVRSRIVEAVEDEIGKFARPANVIMFCDDLPKTRSARSCAVCWRTFPTTRNSVTRRRSRIRASQRRSATGCAGTDSSGCNCLPTFGVTGAVERR